MNPIASKKKNTSKKHYQNEWIENLQNYTKQISLDNLTTPSKLEVPKDDIFADLFSEIILLKKRIQKQFLQKQTSLANELNQQKQLMDIILNNAPIGVWFLDADRKIRFINQTFCDVSGIPEEKWLGTNHYSELMTLDESPICIQSDEIAFSQDVPYRNDEVYTFNNGEVHTFEVIKMRQKDEKGNILGLVSLFIDITGRLETERRLQKSEEDYKLIFESFMDVYYRTDEKMCIKIISPSIQTIAGYTPAELIGRKASDFYYNTSERNELLSALQKFGEVRNFDLKLRAKNGVPMDVSANVRMIQDKNGTLLGLEGILRDITSKKELERRLIESEKLAAMGHLAAGLSHKLRNPLAIINATCQLGLQQSTINKDIRKVLETIKRNADSTNMMIYELLNYASPREIDIKENMLIKTALPPQTGPVLELVL